MPTEEKNIIKITCFCLLQKNSRAVVNAAVFKVEAALQV